MVRRGKSELLLINFESLSMVLQMSLKRLVVSIFQLVPEGPENIFQNMIQCQEGQNNLLLKQGF